MKFAHCLDIPDTGNLMSLAAVHARCQTLPILGKSHGGNWTRQSEFVAEFEAGRIPDKHRVVLSFLRVASTASDYELTVG